MTEAQKQRLEAQLWKIANELRGKMDADEFRDYILGFIFYKYLSEKQYLFANRLLETESIKDYRQVTNAEDLDAIREESLEKLGYFLQPQELFSAITKKGNIKIDDDDEEADGNFILEELEVILNAIEQSTMGNESEDDFNKLFADIDLSSNKLGKTPSARNKLISKVLAHLDAIDFQLDSVDSDVLGDAYEYLIAQFASGAGKKAGEFYTPQQVSKILAKIVTAGKKKIKNAYDPTCGSGSLLLRIGKEVEVGYLCGQESIHTTYNLARMNMILHDVHYTRFNIQHGDTLEEPQHVDQAFEAVVANPPFSAKWKGPSNPLNETDDRFSQYGAIAPASKADFAFLQHMISQMADNGVAAAIMPHGMLFRGNAEYTIRKYLIDKLNYIDAVIGLPSNLFYGTDKEVCIVVLKKCREDSDNILFIDASEDYLQGPGKNTLTDSHVEKIVGAYRSRAVIPRYSSLVSLENIKKNKYFLNIARYVLKPQTDNTVDLTATTVRLRETTLTQADVDRSIGEYCQRLGIDPPQGSNLPLLLDYKKSCVQSFISGKVSFSATGRSEWPASKLSKVLFEHKLKSTGAEEVYSVSVHKGLINQIEHLGRSYSADDTGHYNRVQPGDVVYTKSPTGEFPYGIIKQSHVSHDVIVSPLYGVFRPKTKALGYWLNTYFEYVANTNNHLRPIIQKGVKNTINITNDTFLYSELRLPTSQDQVHEIARFLSLLETKINLLRYDPSVALRFKEFLDTYIMTEE